MKLRLRTPPRARGPATPAANYQSLSVQVPKPSTDSGYDFCAGSNLRIHKQLIGHEGHPVLVVDGLLGNPHSVRDFASRQVRYVPGPANTFYPGTRGRGSEAYVATFVEQLGDAMRNAFSLRDNVRFTFDNMFSLTTTPAAELRPLQKVPHIDIVGPRLLGAVHFLFDRPLGGTGFFRHKASGWESITDERAERFDRIVLHELEESGAPGGYLFEDNPYFERTFNVEPAMDRLVIFSGHLLHSATIPAGTELLHDPRRGRLTINSFISLT